MDEIGDAIARMAMNPDHRREEGFYLVGSQTASLTGGELTLQQIFKNLAKSLTLGFSLTLDELVDLLSMKDTGYRGNDLSTCLLVIPSPVSDSGPAKHK